MPIQYKNIKNPTLTTSLNIGSHKEFNEHGELLSNDRILSALDLDWAKATVAERDIESTDDLLSLIDDIYENGTKDSGGSIDIDDINANLIVDMFNAIRSLQAEVIKLRNSFKYGVTSLTDNKTTISNILHDYDLEEAEEALWATDESELSLIDGMNYDDPRKMGYTPIDDGEVLDGKNNESYVTINGKAYWEDINNIIYDIADPKLYCYITTNNLSILFNFKQLDTKENIFKEIDLSDFNIRESEDGIYNVLLIIGRKQKKNNKEYYNNFLWICVSDLYNNILLNGYLSNDNVIFDSPIYIDNRYTFNKIYFEDTQISKFNFYSKYNDFTNEVQEVIPEYANLKYDAAHITIRSVQKYATLVDIKNQLLENELIYCKENSKLYIISDNKIKNISVGSDEPDPIIDEDMTAQEILDKLIELNIVSVNYSETDNDLYSLNNIEAIKFVNNETGKVFNFTVDAYGELRSEEEETNKLLQTVMSSLTENVINTYIKYTNRKNKVNENYIDISQNNARGFVARFNNATMTSHIEDESKSFGINSDRVKIGAIFAPLTSDSKMGCSHAYVELENTMKKDFYLDGCYLHFLRMIDDEGNKKISHLKLQGKIPAGGTYLIRGKQYKDMNDPNVFIKVTTYDQEWYDDGELIDFSIINNADNDVTFMLTYEFENITENDILVINNSKNIFSDNGNGSYTAVGTNTNDFPYLYDWRFIDAISINKIHTGWTIGQGAHVLKPNSIYKNMFELDPAKQGYNSLNKKDSSRSRYQNSATDLQTLELNNEYIYFPKNKEIKKPVSLYTPKASFEHKNVQTDKTKLDKNKPNMVTVSFGTNIFKTRCFNWISCGLFDEYVFLYDENNNLINKFESYTKQSNNNLYDTFIANENSENPQYPIRKEFPYDVNNIVYASETYDRLYNYFPADGSYYTAHKCIIDITNENLVEPKTYSYIVGRLSDDGVNPDQEHCSKVMHFTLYPNSYEPKLYQTTDQQGFHWQEYQVWGACANKLNDVITNDCNENNIIPILLNTGDMTQSGSRVSEWLDYYNAGECLFDHLEQMNIVGNNDLCGSESVTELGTGDDVDKSNSYYFHVFYCYEVNPIYLTADENKENPIYPIVNHKYIPSLYYIDIKDIRLVFINSEITLENCKTWFKLTYTSEEVTKVANIYTGYTIGDTSYVADTLNYTPIYTMLYHITEDTSKHYITLCHEMPFTVITRDSLYYTSGSSKGEYTKYRSISSGNALIGCHMNQIDKTDNKTGIYWFSRLLEYRKIKLCLGGHKHTYCCTYPLAENYKYGENKWSLIDGPMQMQETLNTELEQSVKWEWEVEENIIIKSNISEKCNFALNHSKLPLTIMKNDEFVARYNNEGNANITYLYEIGQTGEGKDIILPCHIVTETYVNEMQNNKISPVIYFMCQATGYKLTSNKELPTPKQRFSILVPKTIDTGTSDTAHANQKNPMYSIITLTHDENNNTINYTLKLCRIRGIFNDKNPNSIDNNTGDAIAGFKFNQQSYGTQNMVIQTVHLGNLINNNTFNDMYNYGEWTNDNVNLLDGTI